MIALLNQNQQGEAANDVFEIKTEVKAKTSEIVAEAFEAYKQSGKAETTVVSEVQEVKGKSR